MNVRWRSTQALSRHTELTATTGLHVHHGQILTADDMVLKAATKTRLGRATYCSSLRAIATYGSSSGQIRRNGVNIEVSLTASVLNMTSLF